MALHIISGLKLDAFGQAMPGILFFHRIESDTLFALTCDLVVFCNLVHPGPVRLWDLERPRDAAFHGTRQAFTPEMQGT